MNGEGGQRGVAGFVFRRLLRMGPLLLGITFLSFLIIDLAPGDFTARFRLDPRMSPEMAAELRRELGLDDPFLVRYGRWLWRAAHLDLGRSLTYRVPVSELIAMRAGNTALLAVCSMVFAWGLAIPMGVLAGLRAGSLLDRTLSLASSVGMSIPNFFLAFLLMIAALHTGWFPVGGTTCPDYESFSLWGRLVDRIHHLVLPVIVLGTAGMTSLTRLMRANILEVRDAAHVRAARARGLPEHVVVRRHMLRNALNPFVTLAGYELGTLLGGAALVEAVMGLQGLGTLILDGVRSMDIHLVMGSVLIGSVMLLIGNLVADVALLALDPRIDFERLEGRR